MSNSANSLNHKTKFFFVNHFWNCEFLISHIFVSKCLFAQIALWSTKASNALSQSRKFDEIWLIWIDFKKVFISIISFRNLWIFLNCNTFNAIEKLTRIFVIFSFNFWKMFCRKEYVVRRFATLTTTFISFDEILLNFWHSFCNFWISSSQCIIDFSMLLIKLRSFAWNVRLDKIFSKCWKVFAKLSSFSMISTSSKF